MQGWHHPPLPLSTACALPLGSSTAHGAASLLTLPSFAAAALTGPTAGPAIALHRLPTPYPQQLLPTSCFGTQQGFLPALEPAQAHHLSPWDTGFAAPIFADALLPVPVHGIWEHPARDNEFQATACRFVSGLTNHYSNECFALFDTESCGEFGGGTAPTGQELDTAASAPPAVPSTQPSSDTHSVHSSQPEAAAVGTAPAVAQLEGHLHGAARGTPRVEMEGQCRQWAPEEAAGEAGEAAVKCEVEMEEEAEEGEEAMSELPAICSAQAVSALAAVAAAVVAPKRLRKKAAVAGSSPTAKRGGKGSGGKNGGGKKAPAILRGGTKGGGKSTASPTASGSGKRPSGSAVSPSTRTTCACGAHLYTSESKPGRPPTKRSDDRNLAEHKVTQEFLEAHFVTAGMAMHEVARFHPHSVSSYSRRAKELKMSELLKELKQQAKEQGKAAQQAPAPKRQRQASAPKRQQQASAPKRQRLS